MGRYVRIADLAALEGWGELAEASSADADVDGAALQTDPPTPAAAAALARIEQDIEAAEATADGFVLSAYPDHAEPARGAGDPVSTVGARVLDIALERVFGPGTEADGFARRKRVDEALAWLRSLAKGEVHLPDADGDGETDASGIAIDAPDRIFTRKSLQSFTRSARGYA